MPTSGHSFSEGETIAMAWVARRQTYTGSSLLSFSEREATAYHTIVLLRCRFWPVGVYSNKDYNPDKSVYGRLTEMKRSLEYETVPPLGSGGTPFFVENDRLIHYVDNVIYDKTIPLARIQRLIAEGLELLADELEFADKPDLVPLPKKKALLKFLYWVSTRLDVDDDLTLEGEFAVAAHGNRKFALSTHPESIWEWTVLSFLSDFISTTEEEDDPEGDDPSAPESPTDAPPSELPPGGIDVDEPPLGTPPGWFDEPPGDGGPGGGGPGGGFGPVGEALVSAEILFQWNLAGENPQQDQRTWSVTPAIPAPVEFQVVRSPGGISINGRAVGTDQWQIIGTANTGATVGWSAEILKLFFSDGSELSDPLDEPYTGE